MIYNNQSQKKGTLLPLQKLQLVTVQMTYYSRIPKIRMMATIQTVIKIILDNTSHYSEQFLVLITIHPQYQSLCMNSTRTQQRFQTDHYSSTTPVTVHEQYSRKVRGQVTIHEQYQSLFIYNARHNNQKLLFAFSGKGFHPNKSILLSVISAIS